MGFMFPGLRSDICSTVENMLEVWSQEKADWGVSNRKLELSSVNAVTIWDDLESYAKTAIEAIDDAELTGKQQDKGRQALPYKPPFQLPLLSPSSTYSHCFRNLEHSVSVGHETPLQPVYAIDGSDQVAYEFTRGRRGGMGIATYGWVVTHPDKRIDKHPQHKDMQIVPANIQDLQGFAQINFGKYPQVNPASMRVRNYAALRRTQLEFLQLNSLVDWVEPGSIIVLDGFLKAMFSPPVRFIHEIGKRAARRGVIIIGVAKSSKIDMWLHFQDFWKGIGNRQIGWIRPPTPILDNAFPSKSDEDANQYLYLGERGRGIGLPIAVGLNAARSQYYMVDFNCYDFQAAKKYIPTSSLPEIHGKFFPLTSTDKDFISYVLAQVAYYSNQITALGYPFPAAAAHGLVKITSHDVKIVRSIVTSELIGKGNPLLQLVEFQEDPHKIVDSF